jgi:CheY-like chemotaxis protein
MHAALRSYNLLITDDDPSSRETLREIVEPAGYQTLLASNGEEALDIIRAHEVHLALMDMHMPRLTGLETMELARQFRAELPAILISGNQDEELIRRALSQHVYCVLAKPVNRSAVIYVVNRAIQKFYAAS